MQYRLPEQFTSVKQIITSCLCNELENYPIIIDSNNLICFKQEDAHINAPQFDRDMSLFAVFDGHGGVECAKFCERYFGDKLKEQAEF